MTRTLLVIESLSNNAIKSLYVLEDKVIALTFRARTIISSGNISGPALAKVGSQLVTKELKSGKTAAIQIGIPPTWVTFFKRVQQVKSPITIKRKPLSFSPTNATTSSGIPGVHASGLERGEWANFL